MPQGFDLQKALARVMALVTYDNRNHYPNVMNNNVITQWIKWLTLLKDLSSGDAAQIPPQWESHVCEDHRGKA